MERIKKLSCENPLVRKWLLTAFVISMPFAIKYNTWILYLIVLSWLVEGDFLCRLKNFAGKKLYPISIVLFVVYLMGISYTNNLNAGFDIVTRSLAILIFPVILGSLKNEISEEEIQWFLKAFFASVFLMCLMFTVFDANYLDSLFITTRNYRGLYVLFALIIITQVVLVKKSATWPYLLFALCVYVVPIVYFLISTGSRLHILLCIFYIPVVTLVIYVRFKNAIVSLILFSLVSFFVYYVVVNNEFVFSRLKKFVDSGDYIRKRNWETNFNVIKQHWLVGVGTGDGLDHLQRAREGWWLEATEQYNSHNQYLELALATGVIGMAAFLLSLLVPLAYAIKERKYMYVNFLIIVLFSCMTESILMRQKGIIFFAFFNALLLASFYHTDPKKRTLSPSA